MTTASKISSDVEHITEHSSTADGSSVLVPDKRPLQSKRCTIAIYCARWTAQHHYWCVFTNTVHLCIRMCRRLGEGVAHTVRSVTVELCTHHKPRMHSIYSSAPHNTSPLSRHTHIRSMGGHGWQWHRHSGLHYLTCHRKHKGWKGEAAFLAKITYTIPALSNFKVGSGHHTIH